MLRVENLSYRHAHSPDHSLRDLNFELPTGRALLVAGHSGSGKSTLLAILSGLVPHYYKGALCGRISLDGEEPANSTLAEWGFRAALMTQNPETQFLGTTVEEEIRLTLRCRRIPESRADLLIAESLERFGLADLKSQSIFHLSEGQKQRVVLAALTALKPRLLLLDEPGANLDPQAIAELARSLAELKSEGLSLVIADHRLSWLNGLADQVLVLDQGSTVLQGDWALLHDDRRRKAMNLRAIQTPSSPPEAPAPTTTPECGVVIEELRFAWPGGPELFGGFSAHLRPGRVAVLTGVSGRGKTTLAKLLCGLEKPDGGHIRFINDNGEASPPQWGQAVFQNTDHQLCMPTVRREMELALSLGGRERQVEAADLLAEFGLAELDQRHPQSLSGGEKQRLTVAAGLAGSSGLLVLDEPSSGLDGRNLELMAGQIRNAARKGLAILVITHDLELAHLCADDYLKLDSQNTPILTTASEERIYL